MPSASVIVRVTGGGGAGADTAVGADGRSRRVVTGRCPGRYCWPNGGRGGIPGRWPGMPGRGAPGVCVRTG